LRLTLLGVGAMNSPRYAPAGLLVEFRSARVMIDGGPPSEPKGKLDAWLVTDERAELIREIRALALRYGLQPKVKSIRLPGLSIHPKPVVHTNHDAYGYVIRAHRKKVVWAPEFFVFPAWASGADIMFADAAGWSRPITFRGSVGGHASVGQVSQQAQLSKIKRLILAHIGRPTIKAIDSGKQPDFGEYGKEGKVYSLS